MNPETFSARPRTEGLPARPRQMAHKMDDLPVPGCVGGDIVGGIL